MSWEDIKTIKILFDIGDVEYKTYRSLPKDLQINYISRFKRSITVEDFDKFCCSPLLSQEKIDLLKIWGIEQSIPFYVDKNSIKSWRESNKEFDRDLKILLVCQ
jgi:hypothetical protein